MEITVTRLVVSDVIVPSFAQPQLPHQPCRAVVLNDKTVVLDIPDSPEEIDVVLSNGTPTEACSTLLSLLPSGRKQQLTSILTLFYELKKCCSKTQVIDAALMLYGDPFLAQKKQAEQLLELPEHRQNTIIEHAIPPSFYLASIAHGTAAIVDALCQKADMNFATIKQLTAWVREISVRDRIPFSEILNEADKQIAQRNAEDRRAYGVTLKNHLFVQRYPHWASRHNQAENIRKKVRSLYGLSVEYPAYFEGNTLHIKMAYSSEKELHSLADSLTRASAELSELLSLITGEKQ